MWNNACDATCWSKELIQVEPHVGQIWNQCGGANWWSNFELQQVEPDENWPNLEAMQMQCNAI